MDWQYYAITTKGFPEVANPALVCRRRTDEHGVVHDEHYGHELIWAPSDVLARLEAGEPTGEMHLVTEDAAVAFEPIQYARVHMYDPADGKYEYFALVEGGKTMFAIRTWISPQGYDLEETHTRSGWLRSYVRSKLERSSTGGDLVPITREEAEAL
ncbi:hypothetical protein ACFWN2_31355 [Lentzea sp. NPDC058436]|uniref:hypothetical protein n=1 Tax=Lentzea sp. NPDC058436 TaxID=3346499 RepID=UPI0036513BBD